MSKTTNTKQQAILQLLLLIAIFVVLNIVASTFYQRLDLTKEKRFTLTEPTQELLVNLEDIVYVKVYLEGEFPANFKRLQNGTREMLNEFRAYTGNNVEYEFIDPMASEDAEERKAIAQTLSGKGLKPTRLIESEGGYSEKMIFPGAMVSYKGREIPVQLLQEQLNKSPEETINNSIALLEYNLANAIQKLQRPTRPTLGFIEGQGELNEIEVQDIAAHLQSYYTLQRFNLKENLRIPEKFNAIIIAKPTQKFRDQDKYKIDQYIMNGGKVLWLVENMMGHMDSLQNKNGAFVAFNYELGIEDMLFKYGARVNYDIVQDLQCSQIPMVVGFDEFGNARQSKLFNWAYFPVITTHNSEHPVTKNLDAVLLKFSGTIDTIPSKNSQVKKTVLMTTSPYSRSLQVPIQVNVNEVRQPREPDKYNQANLPVGVALEGAFTSAFKNQIAFETLEMLDTLEGMKPKEVSEPTKMVIFADGDLMRNDYDKSTNRPSPLGYYKFTKETFANKELLINAIEWLTDDNGIIAARNKDVKLRLLDEQKVADQKTMWQLINLAVPILLVVLFGFGYNAWRKRKYAGVTVDCLSFLVPRNKV